MRSYALGPRCRAFVYQATLKRVLFPCRVDRVQLWAIGCHTRLSVFPFAPTCTLMAMRSLVGPIGVAIPLCWRFVTRYRLLFFVSSLLVVELAFLIASPSSDRHVNTGLVDDVVVVAPSGRVVVVPPWPPAARRASRSLPARRDRVSSHLISKKRQKECENRATRGRWGVS